MVDVEVEVEDEPITHPKTPTTFGCRTILNSRSSFTISCGSLANLGFAVLDLRMIHSCCELDDEGEGEGEERVTQMRETRETGDCLIGSTCEEG